jgi:quinol-cytochrome oxidoreductase complex cytochrome b subunit
MQKEENVMRMKLTLMAVAYLLVTGLMLATTYKPSGPVPTPKTDRIAGYSFLIERFAG